MRFMPDRSADADPSAGIFAIQVFISSRIPLPYIAFPPLRNAVHYGTLCDEGGGINL